MKIVFIGCVAFSHKMLQHLLQIKSVEVVGVVTRNISHFNSDFMSLEPLASKSGIPSFIAEGNNQLKMAEWLTALQPDVIFCLGWSFLLKSEILNIPRLGVVGYHPAALPKNRGRHPIIWALALGLKETASTFFYMDEGADSGDLISQEVVLIDMTDDADTLYDKLSIVALRQLSEFTAQLSEGKCVRIAQDHNNANYWRKRTRKDGQIDWRMSAESIYNLVRALTLPYVGAHCVVEDKETKIWKCEIASIDNNIIENIEPGKILLVDGNKISVKCGNGVLAIIEHEFENMPRIGEYL